MNTERVNAGRAHPQPGDIYRHFKGNNYVIIVTAKHSENGECIVVYQALYGERAVWYRSLDNFLETLGDKEEETSYYRFEKIIGVD
ncbi:MAG: DUF1653 domain-containing protein [Symploca sp. SIO2G7]|nr:DUF1653 domain-containing protein [Symploca sp. SIO2G7]